MYIYNVDVMLYTTWVSWKPKKLFYSKTRWRFLVSLEIFNLKGFLQKKKDLFIVRKLVGIHKTKVRPMKYNKRGLF